MLSAVLLACVWSVKVEACSQQAAAACSARATQLAAELALEPDRQQAATALQRDLERLLQPRWPGCEVIPYGSITTGLALKESDVDVTIQFSNHTDTSLGELVTEASVIMQEHPELFQVIATVTGARIPVVIAKHVPTGFEVDVSFKNHNGVLNSYLLRYFLNVDERVKTLALLVKYWARLHVITGTRLLPSYGIIIMLIFFLQLREILPAVVSLQKNANSNILDHWNMGFTEEKYLARNNESLCTLLGGFFEYYTNFDFDKYMVSAYAGRPIEVDLFKDVNTVPDEFELYKTNVRFNITTPMVMETTLVQDVFYLNNNLAHYLNRSPNSTFVTQFQYATDKFQENCTAFLEAILTIQKKQI